MGFLPSPSARRRAEHPRLCSCSFPGWERSSVLRDGSPAAQQAAERAKWERCAVSKHTFSVSCLEPGRAEGLSRERPAAGQPPVCLEEFVR